MGVVRALLPRLYLDLVYRCWMDPGVLQSSAVRRSVAPWVSLFPAASPLQSTSVGLSQAPVPGAGALAPQVREWACGLLALAASLLQSEAAGLGQAPVPDADTRVLGSIGWEIMAPWDGRLLYTGFSGHQAPSSPLPQAAVAGRRRPQSPMSLTWLCWVVYGWMRPRGCFTMGSGPDAS